MSILKHTDSANSYENNQDQGPEAKRIDFTKNKEFNNDSIKIQKYEAKIAKNPVINGNDYLKNLKNKSYF